MKDLVTEEYYYYPRYLLTAAKQVESAAISYTLASNVSICTCVCVRVRARVRARLYKVKPVLTE